MEMGVRSVCFRGDFIIKTVVGFLLYSDYIPESEICFLYLAAPPVRSPCNPTNTVAQLSNYAVGAARLLWLIVGEMAWYLYTRVVRERMKAKITLI